MPPPTLVCVVLNTYKKFHMLIVEDTVKPIGTYDLEWFKLLEEMIDMIIEFHWRSKYKSCNHSIMQNCHVIGLEQVGMLMRVFIENNV